MAQIDSPPLGDSDVQITFDRPIFFVSTISKSINLTEMQKSYLRADILCSERAISITFSRPRGGVRKFLELRVSCEPLALQMSSTALICKTLSGFALLLGVEDLYLSAKRPPSDGQDDSERKHWLEIIYHFSGTKWLHIAGDHSTNIMLALRLSTRWRETLLPALHKLYIQEPEQPSEPFQEAVLSFTHSHQLSSNFIGVEYKQQWTDGPHGTGRSSPQITIESLGDDVLLKIFLHYLEDSPKFWPKLVHVCQNWRQIVFSSSQRLHLQLFCEHGTPVSKALDCWPMLPIVVQYGGSSTLDPPAPEDEDNVLAALKQSERVCSISLTITESLLSKLSTIEKPFLELEELDLLSRDNAELALTSIFQWGPHLRSLHLARIAIPALSQLSSCTGLVDLQLYDIQGAGAVSIPPEALADALSVMPQLRSLSLHFSISFLGFPPSSRKQVILPALTCLKYQGTSKYFDLLVASIDAPCLGDVDITFSSLDAWQLGGFIERLEMLRRLSQADISFSQSFISIRFSHPDAPTRLGFRIACRHLDLQLSSLAQILNHFSHVSSRIHSLSINMTDSPSRQVDEGDEPWLNLIRAFGGAQSFSVAREPGTDILRALCTADEDPTVLPALSDLCIRERLTMDGPLWDAAQLFSASRWLSCRPVLIHVSQYSCHRCSYIFKEAIKLRWHLESQHEYPIVYSFWADAADFEHGPPHFQKHLESTHPEVGPIPEHTSSPAYEIPHDGPSDHV